MSDVAVVIPCFDLGRTVREAVESARMQTRPPGELLIVDDGSGDLHTSQTLAELRREGVAVVRTANHGVAAARNLGVRLTSSPYIVLLDADDLLEPTYLEKLAGQLDERPDLDFVTCEIQAFGRASFRWEPPACTLVETLARGGQHVSTMFRRRLWERVGGFDEGLAGYEDYDFWVSALAAGLCGDVVREPLLRYRVRADSRYHRAIGETTYLATMATIYRRHHAAVERFAPEILIAKDRFIEDQRSYRDELVRRRNELERRLGEVENEIVATRAELAARGIEALDWGDFDRLAPLSPVWGLDRGKPIDRHYIEAFLGAHRDDIRGRVLEVKDAGYTTRYGGDRVSRSDVLDRDAANTKATLTGDLSDPAAIPSDSFDCFVFTQALHFNFDARAVLVHALRVLKPGGVLLCTLPAVSRLDYEEGGLDGKDSWRFSESAVRRLFAEILPPDQFEVSVYGNVKAAAGFLYGVSPDEMKREELDHVDPWFPLIYGVRAVKPSPGTAPKQEERGERLRTRAISSVPWGGVVLTYHRVADLDPDPHRLCVPASEFRAQMGLLRERWHPMPLVDLVRAALSGDLPPRAVAVTLDDGCLDNLETASPILLEHGVPATFFVNSARLDERHESPWDRLARIFLAGAEIPGRLELRELPGGVLPTRTSGERAEAHRLVNELLFPLAAEAREELLARIAAWSGLDLAPRDSHRPLLTAELRELAGRRGHSIGAHTVHHLALPHHSPEVQRQEIVECRSALERLLGSAVTSFSYPYGALSRVTTELVAEAGFELAVTVEDRAVRAGVRPLQIPRLEIVRTRREAFIARIDAALGNPTPADT